MKNEIKIAVLLLLFPFLTACNKQNISIESETRDSSCSDTISADTASTTAGYEDSTTTQESEASSIVQEYNSSSEEQRSIVAGRTYPLDKQYIEDLNKNSKSNFDFATITDQYADKWKDAMMQYYNLLEKHLDAKGKEALKASQNEWKKLCETNDKLDQNIIDSYDGGTMGSLASSDNNLMKYRTRAVELETKCFLLDLADIEGKILVK